MRLGRQKSWRGQPGTAMGPLHPSGSRKAELVGADGPWGLGGWVGGRWGPSRHMMRPCPQGGREQGWGLRTRNEREVLEVRAQPGAWVFQRVGRMLVRILGSAENPLEMWPSDPGHILGLASLCTQLTLTCQPSSTPVCVAKSHCPEPPPPHALHPPWGP